MKPAIGSPVSTGRSSGWSAEAAVVSTLTRVVGGIRLAVLSPLPSLSTTPVVGTPSLASSWVTALAAPSKLAGWCAAIAACRATASAMVLSE